jgi:hypothetical protein
MLTGWPELFGSGQLVSGHVGTFTALVRQKANGVERSRAGSHRQAVRLIRCG